MESKKNTHLSGGQILFSPYRNPYETLPGFIKAWAITDVVFSGIWCVVALAWSVLAIVMLGLRWLPEDVFFTALHGAVAALAGGFGLYTNILLLSKKPRAVPMARCLIVLTILHILWDAFHIVWLVCCAVPHLQIALAVAGVLLIGGRIALLVFYWSAVSRAACYFENRLLRIGF